MADKEMTNSTFCIYGAGIVAASIYTAIRELYHKSPLFFLVSDFGGRGGLLGASKECQSKLDGIAVKTLSEWRAQLESCTEDGASGAQFSKMSISDEPDTSVSGKPDISAFEKPDTSASGKSVTDESVLPDFYLIAVPEIHHQDIAGTLLSLDFPKIEASQLVFVTSALENQLMEKYYSVREDCVTVHSLLSESRMAHGLGKKEDRKDWQNARLPSIQVFQVKSHMDKPLRHQPLYPGKSNNDEDEGYLYPIQAGAALTTQAIADIRDDGGENISEKNRNYCELTATYYAWKNSHADYKGICHYRRIFDIDEKQMQELLSERNAEDWDVILPYPSIYYPNLSSEHRRYVSESDWQAALRALEEAAPDYLEVYEELIAAGERRFYNFNMLIAKTPVFDDYCKFLFRALERAESYVTPKEHERADRFAGYLGENLTTLYFLKNRNRIRCVYAGKIWLV